MRWKWKNTTFGTLSIALFLLVVVSGVFLLIPFKVSAPYSSINLMLLSNPWTSFIRNFHFWSSQFFLLFSVIHIFDHFQRKKIGFKPAVGFRLALGVFIILLAMLSGFLLKGDADSLQARQILETLLARIPLIGKSLAFSFLGTSGNFRFIFFHHIATLTFFIAYIIFEHSRRVFPSITDTFLVLFAVIVFSFLFTAPLHDNFNPSVKGPWYFVGFQEILHWLSYPDWALLIAVAIIFSIFIVTTGKRKPVFWAKRMLLFFSVFYLFFTVTGLFFRGERWSLSLPGQPNYRYSVLNNFKTSTVNFLPEFNTDSVMKSPVIQGRRESCLLCHSETHGFADAHKPESIGCFSCHGGNPFATSKSGAHRSLILVPGNIETAQQTCGTSQCHPDITERIHTGLMTTLSGMISVDRTVFGEQNDFDLLTHIHKLGNSAADEHLRNLCVGCHLGNSKKELGEVTEESRGGGCLACHLNYSNEAAGLLKTKYPGKMKAHPSVSLQVSNNHCFGCHSRSGRIATNYEGWHETQLEPENMPEIKGYRLVEGFRVFRKVTDDVHHELGLECIDCHNSYELMGDGNFYLHEEQQQDVQCVDCHFTGEPKLTESKNMDNESAVIAALRFGSIGNKKYLTTKKFGRPLINTFYENDSAFLLTKNRGKKFVLKSPAPTCARNSAHSNLSCSSCHSAWAPSCVGCHNSYEPNESGYNMITGKTIKGSWVEFSGTYTAKLPALGIRKNESGSEVIPVIPGMIMTIDKTSFTKAKHDSLLFRRLFAPAAPHTTSAKGRSCKSCHNNPTALGFGAGELTYEIEGNRGVWKFNPIFENDIHDNLPADAWTGFLQNRSGMVSTRTNVFPFNIEQQEKILTVGACLTCHTDESEVMVNALTNFKEVFAKRNRECILPEWAGTDE